MRLFGFTIERQPREAKAEPIEAKALQPASNYGGWLSLLREPFAGAWQQNREIRTESVLTFSTVFSCVSLIANDIAKLRLGLVRNEDGIWHEVEANSAFWPVLRRPNRYMNRIQFIAQWVSSKLCFGNTYILKERDSRSLVTALYPLHPNRVTVLVTDDGATYYELFRDNLSGLQKERLIVPAKEIIHDVYFAPYHPLCGISPIQACGLAATQGLAIQRQSTQFFEHGASPGGVLTAPGFINEETARRLKEYWDSNYALGGPNVGKVAVLGDGLKYEPLMMTATDAQLLEQLRWTAETVCSVFHVPPHMVGIGSPPTYNNIEALNQAYYSQCLQSLIESIELLLDEGLELPKPLGTEFDLDGLLRMDTATRTNAAANAVKASIMAPNEARKRYFDLPPTEGGDSPLAQQQLFALSTLAERDREKPFSKPTPAPQAAPPPISAGKAEERRIKALREATRKFHALADKERGIVH